MRLPLLLAVVLFAGIVDDARAQDAEANNPETCRDLWAAIGLPARADDDEADTRLVCHLGYILEHDNRAKIPNWVVQRLTREIVSGTNTRPEQAFKPEPNVPDAARAQNRDYTNSKLARGHQAASADYKSDAELMRDTFFYSNAVPQVGTGFNSGVWSGLEALVQRLAAARGEIYVITGPVYQEDRAVEIGAEADACGNRIQLKPLGRMQICAENNKDRSVACEAGVHVPVALFKIVYDPGSGRANAFVLPNVDHRPIKKTMKQLDYLKRYRVGINSVEELTGLKFFEALPARTRTRLRETCPATMFH